ncbi:MAG: DUF4124 domain-containing protein [Rudaea sp.]
MTRYLRQRAPARPRALSCALALAAFAWTATAFAAEEVYKCTVNGKTVYQDYPCAGGKGNVLHSWPTNPAAAAANAEALSRLKSSVREMEQARAARDNAAEVAGLEREIAEYEQAEQRELAELRQRQDYANYNLNGAPWERQSAADELARDMQAISDKYAARKQAARDRIAALRKPATSPAAPR